MRVLMRSPFEYIHDSLHVDDVPLADIAAREGTPCYVYSASHILNQYRAYKEAFGSQPSQVCYAVKASAPSCRMNGKSWMLTINPWVFSMRII